MKSTYKVVLQMNALEQTQWITVSEDFEQYAALKHNSIKVLEEGHLIHLQHNC